MWQRIRENWRSLLLAVGLHAVIIGALVFSIQFGGIVPAGGGSPEKIVDAVVVNPDQLPKPEPIAPPETAEQDQEQQGPSAEQLRQQMEAIKREREQARREAEAARKRAEEQEKALQKQKREAEEARKKAEAERKAREQAKREEEEARKAREKARQEAEEARKQAEAERKAEETREKAEAERKAREEAEARRKAAQEAARREAEARRQALQDSLAAEETSQARAEYVSAIKNHVEANWLRPPGASNIKCQVKVSQLPGGQIAGFELLNTCGSDAVDRSVEQAILKSDPLPRAPDRRVFERELIFTFEPQQ